MSGIDTKVCFINLQKEGISLKETGSSDKRWKICPSFAFLIWFLKRVNGSGHLKPIQSIWMIYTFHSFVKLSKQDNYRCSEEKIKKKLKKTCKGKKSLYNVHTSSDAGIAQLVEHLFCKQGGVGSSPSASTIPLLNAIPKILWCDTINLCICCRELLCLNYLKLRLQDEGSLILY